MELLLTGIRVEGLRCAEFDVHFSGERPTKFTFLQMPNGTGKTTIATCLRAVLSGVANSWSARTVASMQRLDGSGSSGLFEARFLLDGKHLAIGLKFDFVDSTCSYYTTHLPGGRKPKHELPPPLGRFSEPSFVELYIFDAELPQQLLSSASTRAENAIEAFYQLYVLDQVDSALERNFNRAVEAAGASTNQGLARARGEQQRLETQLEQLRRENKNWHDRLAKVEEERAEIADELEGRLVQLEDYRAFRDAAQDDLRNATGALEAFVTDTLSRLQRPLDAFPRARLALDSLEASLDSLRLPESTSRQFFKELAEQDFCLCGRTMDDDARVKIEQAAFALLEDDAAGVVNALKDDVRRQDRDAHPLSPLEAAAQMTRLISTRGQIQTRLAQLRDAASDETDDRARGLNEDLQKLQRNELSLRQMLEDQERDPRPDDTEKCKCIKWFEQQLKKISARVSEISRTVELRERKEKLQDVLRGARTAAADAAREDLIEATNRRLEILLPGENVRVLEIGPSLRLENREAVNQGAMLSIGYAFLTTLFERGNHLFPFVVDAPGMGLDGISREALAGLLPIVANQFVGFILDNERDLVDSIAREVPEQCAFYTIFSDTSRNKPLRSQLPLGEPGPGGTFVVEGREFFDSVKWSERAGKTDA